MSRTRKSKTHSKPMRGTGKQIQHHGAKMSVKKSGNDFGKRAKEIR